MNGARRLHAIETDWLDRLRACRPYAYRFDPVPFTPKITEAGCWVARAEVTPLSVTPAGDLLARHAQAGIELRAVENLWPVLDAILISGLESSIIRKANAQPRSR